MKCPEKVKGSEWMALGDESSIPAKRPGAELPVLPPPVAVLAPPVGTPPPPVYGTRTAEQLAAPLLPAAKCQTDGRLRDRLVGRYLGGATLLFVFTVSVAVGRFAENREIPLSEPEQVALHAGPAESHHRALTAVVEDAEIAPPPTQKVAVRHADALARAGSRSAVAVEPEPATGQAALSDTDTGEMDPLAARRSDTSLPEAADSQARPADASPDASPTTAIRTIVPPDSLPAADTVELATTELRTLGTSLEWAERPDRALQLAREQGKLVFLIQVSGNFAREEFT